MNKSDYHSKIFNGKKGAIIIENITIDNIMTFNELIEECKRETSWKANDYNLATHNCQDFIAKVIEVLKVKRTINNETRYSHMTGKLFYPPVILKALEKNDMSKALKIAESIPGINFFVELGAQIYLKSKKNS
jgi:lipoprotein NlpI